MVRHNLIAPRYLTDQHLCAENVEIDMAIAYYSKYPDLDSSEPISYTLNKGHIKFFKDKLKYLYKRHRAIREEMINRGFKTSLNLNWKLSDFPKKLRNDWKPDEGDIIIIRERIKEKLSKKPDLYRYYGKHYDLDYYIGLLYGKI